MKISPFQAIVLAIFGIAIIAGVVVLATTKGSNKGDSIPVVIWGTMPSASFNSATAGFKDSKINVKITYVEKRPESFDRDLIEALASGVGPDAMLLPQDLITRYRDKIISIPFSSMPLATFRSTFIEEGELFLGGEGILALPFSVDPMVMYWNRDLLSNAGVTLPPKTWDEFITLVPKLTLKDKSQNILKSGLALGEFRNITNAKEIISALLMQTGNSITSYTSDGLLVTLSPATLGSTGAINFYTDFANPVKPDYSWNRSLPNSVDMFSAGDLAFYFGFTSEIGRIRDKNPNLNFDVTFFPQPKSAPVAITFGRMQGLSVLKNSRNISGAFEAIVAITGGGPMSDFTKATGLPPVLRNMLVSDPSNPYQAVFYNSAIRARGWLDPNPTLSKSVFQNMIESINSGEFDVGQAINNAGGDLQNLAR